MALSELIDAIMHQEETLILDRCDEDVAWRLGSMLREWGAADALPIVIDIRLFHRRLFFTALPGSTPDNIEWERRKHNVVERYSRSRYRVDRDWLRRMKRSQTAMACQSRILPITEAVFLSRSPAWA